MQTAIILHCGGPGVLEIYDQFEFEDDDEKHVPKVVLVKIEEYCNPKQNQVIQTFRFWNVQVQELFDSFLQGYVLVPSRDFKERTWMIWDKIVFTVEGKLQERLLRESSI